MTIVDAIKQLTVETWIRPVTWRGSRQAFALCKGWTVLVPTADGGMPHMTNLVADIVSDWEVVTPDMVLNE